MLIISFISLSDIHRVHTLFTMLSNINTTDILSGMHPFIHSINSTVYSELSTEAVIGQRRRGNSSSPVQFYLKRGSDGEFHRRGMGSSLVEELRCCMSSCSQKKKKEKGNKEGYIYSVVPPYVNSFHIFSFIKNYFMVF